MMEKMKMHSPNLTQDNIVRIRELFPGCVTEAQGEDGQVKLAVDFDQLRQELSESIVEGPQERYHLNWPGKREALLTANAAIAKTLRPCREESVDFDTTKNLFIEGDNLDALKLLQETYLGKVKMIYIDPPYNTGNDFIYQDDFAVDKAEFELASGDRDDQGNKLFDQERWRQNSAANGKFHSDWLSMIYSRLKLARNLLSEEGVICISIDDKEKANLRKTCDEVFGGENFLAEMVVLTGANQSGEGVKIQTNTEYCMVYCRNINSVTINRVDKVDESLRNLNDAPTPLETRPDMGYTIYYNPTTKALTALHDYDKTRINENLVEKVYKNDSSLIAAGYVPIRPGFRSNKLHRWRWGIDTFFARIDEVVIECDRNDNFVPKFKQSGFNAPKNILQYGSGTTEVSEVFDGNKIFDFPKSQRLISRLLDISSNIDSIVVDFFAGSATTAHAVMQLNAQDGGNRKFIMVQLPEPCDEKSEAFKAGYNTIEEISKERIRRAGRKILEGECHEDWNKDIGFRVLKTDSSNMADVYYTPDAIEQGQLKIFTDNIKPDRKPEDLLFQVLLDWGVDLSLPIRKETIQSKTVFFVNEPPYDLVACFDTGVNEDLVKELARFEPLRVVFRDTGFVSDAVKINVEQIFKQMSPSTEVKSI